MDEIDSGHVTKKYQKTSEIICHALVFSKLGSGLMKFVKDFLRRLSKDFSVVSWLLDRIEWVN